MKKFNFFHLSFIISTVIWLFVLLFHQWVEVSLIAIALLSLAGLIVGHLKRKQFTFHIIVPLILILEVIYLLMSLALLWLGLSFH